ncbi:MAG: TonB-dependent receptor [Sphingobacteriia bacterium]|nr:TonB-dependent receptor [Sphingobacteriia bacterium]
MKRSLLSVFALAMIFVVQSAFGQVTTSAISGRVMGGTNESLPGATVVAIHQPSGSQYGTTTDVDGLFRILNMRVGGPYSITVTYVGYSPFEADDVYLSLGQTFSLNVQLTEQVSQISGVEVIGTRNDLFDGNRTGAVTNIANQQITALPTISRSINDFTRLSPFTGVGNSFAGRDGRYNNITIDGANFNNNFGLSSKNLPGGDAQPISLDAIEEISVNIAPFDIRQSNFTGANINAVTRSGDNTFKGSAYMFYRDKSFNGDKVGDQELTLDKTTTTTYGARFGGKIIEDKLFFFANAEIEKSSFPGIPWKPSDPENGINPNPENYISRTTLSDLSTMRNHLINQYQYDPGNYEGFGNFESNNYKLLGRIDYNINKNHKFTLRYNYVESTNDQQVNATSAPLPRSNFGRIGETSMAFENANYGFLNTVSSITAELNSVFGSNMANKFLVTYTKIRDTRDSDSDIFPFVDIYEEGTPYMSFGYELFTFENDVKNNVFSVTDNFSYFLGKHTITAGVSFEHLYFGNSYKRYGTSYYRYASMADFMNNAAPTAFGITYPYENAGDGYAELNFGWGSLYVQDEFQVNDQLKLTGGLRLEMPFYFDDLLPNSSISELTFKDNDGNDEKLDVGNWPDPKLMISPRFGFNWDAKGDRTLQVRGGTGLFTGRLPFVWFTNQPTNSGTLQNTVEITDEETLANLLFNPDPKAHLNKFPQTPGDVAPGNIAIVSKDFKMPQVWRTNLAADIKLPVEDLVLTLEGLYSKDINAIVQRNANQVIPTETFAGADNRVKFPSGTANRRINPGISSAMVLDNAKEGHSYSLTMQLTKPFQQGFFGTLAYTYTMTKDLSANPGSAANSAWQSNPSINHQNDPELGFSQFSVPHRIVGAISYNVEYAGHLGTTFTLFYSGSNQGRLTYIYSNDMNGDGNSADIMYIPKDNSEIEFVDIVSGEEVVFTADQQRDAFWKYVDQDKYLSDNKGSYAERYGVLMPWYHRFDLRILQDIFTSYGKDRRHNLQISLDFLNIGNLINSDWGVLKAQNLGRYDITLLRYEGVNESGVPTYTMNRSGGDLPTETFKNVLSTSSTWGAQIGLRYTF